MILSAAVRRLVAVVCPMTVLLAAALLGGTPVDPPGGAPPIDAMDREQLAEALSERGVRVIEQRTADGTAVRSGSARPTDCEWWTTLQTTRILVCEYEDVLQARQALWQRSGPIVVRRLFHRGRVVVQLPAGAGATLQSAVADVMQSDDE